MPYCIILPCYIFTLKVAASIFKSKNGTVSLCQMVIIVMLGDRKEQ